MNNDATEDLASSYDDDEAKTNLIINRSQVCLKRTYLNDDGPGTASVALFILLSFLQLRNKINYIKVIACGVASLGYALFRRIVGFITLVPESKYLAMEKLTR